MKLYLVQHADALSKDADPGRPLSEKGRADAEKMAAFLLGADVAVDQIVHSGKLRAEQTANALAKAVCPGQVPTVLAGLGPKDSTDKLCNTVAATKGKLMVVGHLPFMARAAARCLTGSELGCLVAFEPGTVACFERLPEGAEHHWSLNWVVRPSQLPEA